MSWQTALWPHASSAHTSWPFSGVTHSCSLPRTSPTANSTMPVLNVSLGAQKHPPSSRLYDYMTNPACLAEYSGVDQTPIQALVLNRASERPLPLTDTFPQSRFKGLLDSALLPALSVCERLIFLLNQLKTQSQSKAEPGMCCCLWHPRAEPCVGPCCISWGLSLWLSLLYLRKSPFLGHIPAKLWHSCMNNYRWI